MIKPTSRPNLKQLSPVKRWWRSLAIALLITIPSQVQLTGAANSAQAKPDKQMEVRNGAPIRPRSICPSELEPLTKALLRDLPSYINRISHQRGGSQTYRYAIASSPANMTPLPVVTSTPDPEQGGLYQVFFTLLERQYDTQQKKDYQSYHWLFLAHTEKDGWQLAMIYSRQSSYPDTADVSTPLRETTQEATGLAIRYWLRDCRAGAVSIP